MLPDLTLTAHCFACAQFGCGSNFFPRGQLVSFIFPLLPYGTLRLTTVSPGQIKGLITVAYGHGLSQKLGDGMGTKRTRSSGNPGC